VAPPAAGRLVNGCRGIAAVSSKKLNGSKGSKALLNDRYWNRGCLSAVGRERAFE
jgi:hypothetical protein